jgi:hypothetical protein
MNGDARGFLLIDLIRIRPRSAAAENFSLPILILSFIDNPECRFGLIRCFDGFANCGVAVG